MNVDTLSMLNEFYEDGLKECSWIPDTFKAFLKLCDTSQIMTGEHAIAIFVMNDNFLYLDTIYVAKDQRGKGYGTEMMGYIIKNARTCIICNKNLVSFYEKLGFKQDKDLPYAVMIKEIEK